MHVLCPLAFLISKGSKQWGSAVCAELVPEHITKRGICYFVEDTLVPFQLMILLDMHMCNYINILNKKICQSINQSKQYNK